MFGFKKYKNERHREIQFLGLPVARYKKKPSPQQVAVLALQKTLGEGFWVSSAPGVEPDVDGLLVTLTSYGDRINTVHITLESLFRQSLRPEKIILWLDEAELEANKLPSSLRHAAARGVDIRFCPNLLSYKKIIPALQQFPGRTLVTVDDDIMYPEDFLANLAECHRQRPEAVVCYRAHQMTFDERGHLKPYREWQKYLHNAAPGRLVFPTGAGGVLYPAGAFAQDVDDENTFLKLAPFGDDIWLKAMTMLAGRECWVVPGDHLWSDVPPSIEGTQTHCLAKDNLRTGNDQQIKQVFDAYKIWPLLAGGE